MLPSANRQLLHHSLDIIGLVSFGFAMLPPHRTTLHYLDYIGK